MPHSLDQLIPSLQSMGVWTYWILALFAMLEAIIFTGVAVPGALAVIAGGILVQRGVIDFFDLGWFVLAGTVLGSEVSFRLGRLAALGMARRGGGAASTHTRRAADLLVRYGGFAMMIGRFLGPLSAFVPFSAALAGMAPRRFLVWNVASAAPYAFGLPAIGYFSGRLLAIVGGATPWILAAGVTILAVLVLVRFLSNRLRRAMPALAEIGRASWQGLSQRPVVGSWRFRHPKMTAVLAARLAPDRFSGLPATALVLFFGTVLAVYLDGVFDYLTAPAVTDTDMRLANLLYAVRDPHLVSVFAWITAFGGWKVWSVLVVGASVALVLRRRPALIAGLWIAVLGNQITVTLLKHVFDRPRSPLGVFAETSGSFPSGHAASSVAILGMLVYVAWRTRVLPGEFAALAGLAIAGSIGASRLYLIEHYLSDVMSGWLVGALWLILGIAGAEGLRLRWPVQSMRNMRNMRSGLAAWAVGASVLLAAGLATTLSHPALNRPPQPTRTELSASLAAPFADGHAPGKTFDLFGAPRASIYMTIAAETSDQITTALQEAGWIPVPRPNLGTLFGAIWSDLMDSSPTDPAIVPTFWHGMPNTLGFVGPTETEAVEPRLHLRLWPSRFRFPDRRTIWVATLVREAPLAGLIPDDEASSGAATSTSGVVAALSQGGLAATSVSVPD
ncbi:membrane protein DedA with SNARE-associated domain [Palleronia aestuarii]|uniref:Membrane protein DedA with SNARE-associated domain n=1 Tax=Palleronia aestuarii TaxID=568105 RepID=A0A2W7MYG1_9RHOB|nr:bifunctional DedA family/phosphatase PAP2 family protein [Palleronia aestuarii]PZX12988.1 membrane protein DedA with SNARE-associated domain [Palleronia aestuarii]